MEAERNTDRGPKGDAHRDLMQRGANCCTDTDTESDSNAEFH